ncbi:MAG TPA: 5'-3' exonuclease H3TH domain-containing protein [Thermoanaerobaculia bacterium]|jgi:5'-3' exonuclease|nr:5'-3' exonuclease H3TH domain-containing protein [Thermoanaerobaculia bacterium]
MPPTVHLIDASPYLFRAFFSVPRSVADGKGRPINAVYGFSGFLTKYLADQRPTHIAVTFDRHFNGSFRNEFYPPYKAHREASPPELDRQVDPCVALAEALGMATFIDERYEADDLIATIIRQTEASGAHFVIVTTDKDLAQLVSETVTLVDPGRGLRFDAAGVEAKFGVRPDQITDYLGLAGDAVDNIPGVRGIGPKTAAQLLKRHGTLEGVFEHRAASITSAARIDPALVAKLKEDAAIAGLSKRLATVADDAPIEVTVDALRYRGPEDARAASRDYLATLKK